jgi:hypothetical protein
MRHASRADNDIDYSSMIPSSPTSKEKQRETERLFGIDR